VDARLYVYYRVDANRLAATMQAARAMQAALLARHAGLAAELLRRPDLRDGQVTLMEAYAECRPQALTDGFIADLAQAAAGLPQPRHLERFDRL
jgi:Domain of unknown function (DUF4936)